MTNYYSNLLNYCIILHIISIQLTSATKITRFKLKFHSFHINFKHFLLVSRLSVIMPPPHRVEALSDTFVWRLSVAYIGPNSRTERPRTTKIGTEVAHVTRDSHTTFKVKRSKVNLQRAESYCGGLPHSLLTTCCQTSVCELSISPRCWVHLAAAAGGCRAPSQVKSMMFHGRRLFTASVPVS